MIVLSAWDLELKKKCPTKPQEWLKWNMPLLFQFLEANFEKVDFEVIGVSAQGGDFLDSEIVDELQELAEACLRVKVISGENPPSNDITLPINWIVDKWKQINPS